MSEKSSLRREAWRRLIAEQARSGQGVRAFCRARGVREPSFYEWRRRFSAEAPVKFALVKTGEPEPGPGLDVTLTTGERLRIPPGTDAATLRTALAVLRERP